MTQERPLAPTHITAIAPYQPGKPIEELRRELGGAWPAEGAIKLASNENPLGPSPRALEAIRAAAGGIARYPDASSFELRERLARYLSVDRDQVLIGSGSNEIINLVVQTFCAADDEVLTPRHQFICYRLAAESLARRLCEADNGPAFALDAGRLLAAVTPATKVVFLANPNNPTGTYLPEAGLVRLVRELPRDIVLCLDEAYFEYVDAADYRTALSLLGERERLIVLRTFSKIYGLAGLRIGYGVAHAPLIDLLNRVRLAFNVSSLAQAGALAALDDEAHVARAHRENAAERRRLATELAARGLQPTPSQGNFILCEAPAGLTGPGFYEAMLKTGVIVRPLAPYHLPRHVRISVGTAEENTRLLAEIDRVVTGPR